MEQGERNKIDEILAYYIVMSNEKYFSLRWDDKEKFIDAIINLYNPAIKDQ